MAVVVDTVLDLRNSARIENQCPNGVVGSIGNRIAVWIGDAAQIVIHRRGDQHQRPNAHGLCFGGKSVAVDGDHAEIVLGGFAQRINVQVNEPVAGHVACVGVAFIKFLAVSMRVAVAIKRSTVVVQMHYKFSRPVIQPGVIANTRIGDRVMAEHDGQVGFII